MRYGYISLIEETKWDDVNYFVKRYHKLLNMDENKYDKPFDKYQDFNSMGEYEIYISDAILTTYDYFYYIYEL